LSVVSVHWSILKFMSLLQEHNFTGNFLQRKLNTTSNDYKLIYMGIKYLTTLLMNTLEISSMRGITLCEDSVTEYLLCHASINEVLLIMLALAITVLKGTP